MSGLARRVIAVRPLLKDGTPLRDVGLGIWRYIGGDEEWAYAGWILSEPTRTRTAAIHDEVTA